MQPIDGTLKGATAAFSIGRISEHARRVIELRLIRNTGQDGIPNRLARGNVKLVQRQCRILADLLRTDA